MEIVLVHGLWLNGSSWDAVAPILRSAGHRVQALTLPGMESKESDRTSVTRRDHVNAIVSALDEAAGPVLLVGHSVGAGLAHAAVDARPDRVARAVHVGGFPTPHGQPMLSGLTAENGEVPMPDWAEIGEEANLADFDTEATTRFYEAAIPAPERVLTDAQELHDDRRYEVPVTSVCPEYTAADLRQWIADGEPAVSELALTTQVDFVDLPGGHWPQLTQPERLAAIVLAAAEGPPTAGAAAGGDGPVGGR